MEKAMKEKYSAVLNILTNNGEREAISERVQCKVDLVLGTIPTEGATFNSESTDADGNKTTEPRSWVPISLGDGVISLSRVLRFPIDKGWGTASVEGRLEKLVKLQKDNDIIIKIGKYGVPKNSRFDNEVPQIEGVIRWQKKA